MRRCRELPLGAHGERAGVQAVQVGHDQQQVRRGLHGQEAAARHVDAEGVVEGFNGCADRRFQLDDVLPAVESLTTKRGQVLVENMLMFFIKEMTSTSFLFLHFLMAAGSFKVSD